MWFGLAALLFGCMLGMLVYMLQQLRVIKRKVAAQERLDELEAEPPPQPDPEPPPGKPQLHLVYDRGKAAVVAGAVATAAWAQNHKAAALVALAGLGLALLIPSATMDPPERKPPIALPAPEWTVEPPGRPSLPKPPLKPEPPRRDVAPDPSARVSAPETPDAPDAPVQEGAQPDGQEPPSRRPEPDGEQPRDEPPGEPGEPEAPPDEPKCSIIHVDLSPTVEACLLPE